MIEGALVVGGRRRLLAKTTTSRPPPCEHLLAVHAIDNTRAARLLPRLLPSALCQLARATHRTASAISSQGAPGHVVHIRRLAGSASFPLRGAVVHIEIFEDSSAALAARIGTADLPGLWPGLHRDGGASTFAAASLCAAWSRSRFGRQRARRWRHIIRKPTAAGPGMELPVAAADEVLASCGAATGWEAAATSRGIEERSVVARYGHGNGFKEIGGDGLAGQVEFMVAEAKGGETSYDSASSVFLPNMGRRADNTTGTDDALDDFKDTAYESTGFLHGGRKCSSTLRRRCGGPAGYDGR